MTKLDIVRKVVDEAGLPRNKAEDGVEAVFNLIKETLAREETVILRRFGSFYVRKKGRRIGRNPKTGEEAEISARKVVRFKSGKYFRAAVNGEN